MEASKRYAGDSLSSGQRFVYVVVLGALTALGPFTVDLYLPAFPTMQQDLGVSAAEIQLTLTGTLIGFATGQLFMGPWSDRVGRRLPLILSAVLHVAASIGIALGPGIMVIGILRVLQGFGASAGGVVSMATIRDLFGGRPLVRMLSRMALVNGFAPVIAPVIGSWLLTVTSWRGIFWVLAAYGLIAGLCVAFFIVETLPPERRKAQRKSLGERYGILFRDRTYVGTVLVAGMTSTGLFGYLTASPFLFQDIYGLTASEYGRVFAGISMAVIIGVQTSSRLMDRLRIGPQWIMAATTVAQVITALAIVINGILDLGFWGTLIPLWLFILACGFSFPAQQVLALAGHGEQAGTAASVMGALNFGVAGILTPIIGLLGTDSAVPMGSVMLIAGILGTLFLWGIVRPRAVPSIFD